MHLLAEQGGVSKPLSPSTPSATLEPTGWGLDSGVSLQASNLSTILALREGKHPLLFGKLVGQER